MFYLELLFETNYADLIMAVLIVKWQEMRAPEIKLISFWNAKIQIFEGIFLAMNTEQVVFWQNSI